MTKQPSSLLWQPIAFNNEQMYQGETTLTVIGYTSLFDQYFSQIVQSDDR